MPTFNLLAQYRLALDPRGLIFVWLALSRPEQRPRVPFRALLDTGFNGTLIVPTSVLDAEFGAGTRPREIGRGSAGRAGDPVGVRAFRFDLWGCAESNGPGASAPAGPRYLASEFLVHEWQDPRQNGPDALCLLGMEGLRTIEAVLQCRFVPQRADLTAVDHDPPY